MTGVQIYLGLAETKAGDQFAGSALRRGARDTTATGRRQDSTRPPNSRRLKQSFDSSVWILILILILNF